MNSDSFGIRGQGEGLWDWNPASNRIHFSPGWLCLVGCDEHEVGTTHEAWLERVHPDDRSQVKQAVDAALADGPDAIRAPPPDAPQGRLLPVDVLPCGGAAQRRGPGRARQRLSRGRHRRGSHRFADGPAEPALARGASDALDRPGTPLSRLPFRGSGRRPRPGGDPGGAGHAGSAPDRRRAAPRNLPARARGAAVTAQRRSGGSPGGRPVRHPARWPERNRPRHRGRRSHPGRGAGAVHRERPSGADVGQRGCGR